ncbi:hypothetical protein ACFYON_22030 [Micromonospora sp. NPDC005686]|uniref:hypothetical protein n=1 Tax=unclassified Micromonospora TaxID=2617518 RepID=UPI0033A880C0
MSGTARSGPPSSGRAENDTPGAMASSSRIALQCTSGVAFGSASSISKARAGVNAYPIGSGAYAIDSAPTTTLRSAPAIRCSTFRSKTSGWAASTSVTTTADASGRRSACAAVAAS